MLPKLLSAPPKWGSEFLVNSTTLDSQNASTVTGLANGRFVVAWTDASTYEIRAQVFNANGSPAGAEFRANTYTSDIQDAPSIAGLSDGRFVIAWQDYSHSFGTFGDADSFAIAAQIFNSDGAKSGPEFQVNGTPTNAQILPAVTGLSGG